MASIKRVTKALMKPQKPSRKNWQKEKASKMETPKEKRSTMETPKEKRSKLETPKVINTPKVKTLNEK